MTARFSRIKIPILVAGICVPALSSADIGIDISGFGTLGYVRSDNPNVEYVVGEGEQGASDEGSFKPDSRLGVQLDKELTDTFSVTVQGLSRQNYSGEFTPRIEWAFLRAYLGSSTVFRIGRIGLPFFMISDFRDVGYANTQIRPPEDVYIQAALGSYDGIDITRYFEFGETLVTANAFVGLRTQQRSDDAIIKIRDGVGVNLTVEHGPVRVRMSHIQTKVGVSGGETDVVRDQLSGAASLFPELAEVAEDWNGELKQTYFSGLSVDLDLDPFLLTAEYTTRDLNSYLSSNDAWYVTAAYRWGDFTPYVTYSAITQNSKSSINFPSSPLLNDAREPITALYRAIDQSSVIAGLRWDFMPGAALKFQAENIARENTGITFTPIPGAPSSDSEDVKLVSVAVDFTF